MARCNRLHAEWDRLANGEVQSGEFPPGTNVTGPVLWYVFQGPYSGLGEAWNGFMKEARATFPAAVLEGPPGDVYICNPRDHTGPDASRLTTLLWVPLRPGTAAGSRSRPGSSGARTL